MPPGAVRKGGANPSFSLKNSIVVFGSGFPSSSIIIPEILCSKPRAALQTFTLASSVFLHLAVSSKIMLGVASRVKLLRPSPEESVGLP